MDTPSTDLQKVADFFLASAVSERRPITNKKLQKLVYYGQAWSLALNNEPLFQDPIEAWVHGPAIRTLYNKYKRYGYMPITDQPQRPVLEDRRQDVLEDVWNIYGKYDADYLETLSHNEQPWIAARNGAEDDKPTSTVIDTRIMREFYAALLQTIKTRATNTQATA